MAKTKRHNDSIGQDREETDESGDMESNEEVMKGHKEDSRFDEGSTDHKFKIVRPASTAKTTPAKYEKQRKWNLGSNCAH